MTVAILDARMDLPLALVLPIGLALGGLIGLINGAITLYFRVHSLIVTLGVGTFLHGITLWIGNSQTISGVSPMLMEWVIIQRVFGVPIAFYYAIGLAVAIWYMLSYTAFGQQLLFTGRGREVGRLTGVAVDRVRLTAFVLSGMLGLLPAFCTPEQPDRRTPVRAPSCCSRPLPPPFWDRPAFVPAGSIPGDRSLRSISW